MSNSNLQTKIAAAASRVYKTAAAKAPKGQPTVTQAAEADIVEVEGQGRFFAGPKLDRYFSERDQFARLDAALKGHDKGTLERAAFIAELRAISALATTIHASRYVHLASLANALEAGEPTARLRQIVEATTNDARTYLDFALSEAGRAPDEQTISAAESVQRAALPPSGSGGPAVVYQSAMDVGPNRKVG